MPIIDFQTRRAVLRGALAGAAGAVVPRLTLAKTTDATGSSDVVHTPLSDSLHLFQGAGGNVVALSSPDAVLMVDSGLEQQTSALLAKVSAATAGRRVDVLFNTHWHWEHTGGNATFAKSGARIIAHENTRLWLGARVDSSWEHRTYAPRPARALPTQTFIYGAQTYGFGGQNIEYALMPQAHTDGDIYVFFPKDNVLVAGGVVSDGTYPLADYCTGGWLGGMVDGLKAIIAKSDAQTRIIGASGAPRTRAQVQAQLEMCTAVISKIGTQYFKGGTWEQFRDSKPTSEFDAQWGNPEPFLQVAWDGAWYHVNDIRRYSR